MQTDKKEQAKIEVGEERNRQTGREGPKGRNTFRLVCRQTIGRDTHNEVDRYGK